MDAAIAPVLTLVCFDGGEGLDENAAVVSEEKGIEAVMQAPYDGVMVEGKNAAVCEGSTHVLVVFSVRYALRLSLALIYALRPSLEPTLG